MKRKILWASISINIAFFILLALTVYRYREDLYQKYLIRKHSAAIVMFGDSHTEGGKWNFLLDKHPVLRMGWGGFNSDQLAYLLPNCIGYKPKIVFILCGANDVYSKCFSVDHTLSNYRFMADTLRKNHIKPVFQKLFYEHNVPEFNKIADSINTRLTDFCLKEKIDLLDIGKNMYDSTGLKADLTIDNYHLNEQGYKMWGGVINTFLKNK